jgi:maltooligosyltrehalose trehalohydrolase
MSTPSSTAAGFPLLGPQPSSADGTPITVWAPDADRVEVVSGAERHPLEPGRDGVWQGETPLAAGAEYLISLDGGDPLPDPCSRRQPHGLRGPSQLVDLARPRQPFTAPTLEELVIYEMHIGTFSQEGTFASAARRLAQLRELGVTAVEVMPIATFPGHHGWGYDGVYLYATQESYGGPAGFAAFVEAAHGAGMAVILDVVYNHLGAGSDRIEAFGPYFTDRYDTVWGKAIDYARRPVREWAIQNAEMWVRDFGVDGLRLDATHAIFDESDPHVLRELRDRVKQINPRALIISEMEIGDLRPIEQWGHYGKLADVARELTRPQGSRFVVCAQNHDQVGNRAIGDRLRGRDLRLAAFLSILSRGTPLLFQGEEYDEASPFQYFVDHIDPEIARLTREGRRREFAEFSDFSAEEIPDPQDPATFERSKLNPATGDPQQLEYYRELIRLRGELGDAPLEIVECDEERRLLRLRRGRTELIANFSDHEQDGVPARTGKVNP